VVLSIWVLGGKGPACGTKKPPGGCRRLGWGLLLVGSSKSARSLRPPAARIAKVPERKRGGGLAHGPDHNRTRSGCHHGFNGSDQRTGIELICYALGAWLRSLFGPTK